MASNKFVIASAGARKTQAVVEAATTVSQERRVLVTTYTTLNQREIVSRLPPPTDRAAHRITVQGWLPFLLEHGVRPYQRLVIGDNRRLDSFNFNESRNRFASKNEVRYWLDSRDAIFRQSLSEFACVANAKSGGAVIQRLERIFDYVCIDEAQDLVGWDLELLELLFRSQIEVLIVGDPRQHTYATNDSPKNKPHRGAGLVAWVKKKRKLVELEENSTSYRCNQEICDFADSLFPDLPRTTSANTEITGHDGVFRIRKNEVLEYVRRYSPQVLRERSDSAVQGLKALNIGQTKGLTYDRVLIFPTAPMAKFVKAGDDSKLKPRSRCRLYVAVTRARHSTTFVID